jgi:hypothetical protein
VLPVASDVREQCADRPRAKLDDVTDGLGTTLLLVEVANSGVHWMEPRDLDFSRMSRTINSKTRQGISSPHAGGAIVAFAGIFPCPNGGKRSLLRRCHSDSAMRWALRSSLRRC